MSAMPRLSAARPAKSTAAPPHGLVHRDRKARECRKREPRRIGRALQADAALFAAGEQRMKPQQLQDGAGQHAEHRQQGDQNSVTHPGAGLQRDVHQAPGQREAERGDEQRCGGDRGVEVGEQQTLAQQPEHGHERPIDRVEPQAVVGDVRQQGGKKQQRLRRDGPGEQSRRGACGEHPLRPDGKRRQHDQQQCGRAPQREPCRNRADGCTDGQPVRATPSTSRPTLRPPARRVPAAPVASP